MCLFGLCGQQGLDGEDGELEVNTFQPHRLLCVETGIVRTLRSEALVCENGPNLECGRNLVTIIL